MLDRAIAAELSRHADQGRAQGEKAYLKSSLTHLGVGVPVTRRIVTHLARSWPGLDREETLAAARTLWASDIHEHRLAAAMLLADQLAALRLDDLDLVEEMLRGAGTWALADPLAVPVAGGLLLRRPAAQATYQRWAAGEQMWVRRGGILAFLLALRVEEGFTRYFPVLTGVVDPLLVDGRFFVQKAIGWVLRDAAKKHPNEVYEWMLPRAGRASAVTLREVVRPLPAPDAERLCAARRRG